MPSHRLLRLQDRKKKEIKHAAAKPLRVLSLLSFGPIPGQACFNHAEMRLCHNLYQNMETPVLPQGFCTFLQNPVFSR